MIFRLTLLSVVVSTLAFAQEYRAQISGQVTDPSGAAVAGAKIVAINTATNIIVNTTAASDGHYVLAQVPTGSYTLTCEATALRSSRGPA